MPVLHIVFSIVFKLEYWKFNDATGVLTLSSLCRQPPGLTGDVGGDWAHEDTEQGQRDKHGAVRWTSAATHLFRIHAAFTTVACHITTRTPGLPRQPICRMVALLRRRSKAPPPPWREVNKQHWPLFWSEDKGVLVDFFTWKYRVTVRAVRKSKRVMEMWSY